MDPLTFLELDDLGGVHAHHVELDSLDRPRGIKTAAQASAKWLAGTQAASGDNGSWATNLGNTTKPIVAAALAQQTVMLANFTRSVNDGKWANNLSAVGDAGIKSAAKAKAANYGTGTMAGSEGATKQAAFMQKLIQFETANLPQIYAMPKGNLQAGIARMTTWAQIMAGGAGSFG